MQVFVEGRGGTEGCIWASYVDDLGVDCALFERGKHSKRGPWPPCQLRWRRMATVTLLGLRVCVEGLRT